MNLEEVLSELASKGTEQNRKVYARHGYGENLYGVPFGELRTLAKTIGCDHALALALWKTGNADARLLATMVADPARMSARELDGWVREVRFYVLADQFSALAARSPLAREKAEEWSASTNDFVSQAAWNLVAFFAREASDVTDQYFAQKLQHVAEHIHAAPNRTRHAMNMALCAIGGHRAALRTRALGVAKEIGKVVVDHGETGCQTPDAVAYIAKMVAHQVEVDEREAARQAAKAPPRAVRPAQKAVEPSPKSVTPSPKAVKPAPKAVKPAPKAVKSGAPPPPRKVPAKRPTPAAAAPSKTDRAKRKSAG